MGEALFTILGIIAVGSLIIGVLMSASSPTDKEKYYYYKRKEYEENHPNEKVDSYKDMK